AHRLAVDVNRAGTALRQPAAEARAVQREVVAQRIKQRHVGIVDGDPNRLAVHVQRFSLSHSVLPGCSVSLCGLFFECFQPTSAGSVAPYAPVPPIERRSPCLVERSRAWRRPRLFALRGSSEISAVATPPPPALRRPPARPWRRNTLIPGFSRTDPAPDL